MFNFKKENLHHAYLIPGDSSVLPNLLKYLKDLGLPSYGSPDFFLKQTTTFYVEDVEDIKNFQLGNAISSNKKVAIIYANYFSHQSQNSLLKIFEEPLGQTHFFVITPQDKILIPTLKSRFITLKISNLISNDMQKMVETFLKSEKEERLSQIGKILKKFEDDEDGSNTKIYIINFLNALEVEIYKKVKGEEKTNIQIIWKIKDYMNSQGASLKNLFETLALTL